ncbi:MAG: glycosyltransferase family 2 protein [Muribaculaceae bacterium]
MKLSIITINYNNREGLWRTIKSVVNQTCRDFEYIIIDGGSDDGSVDVIKQYADQIDYWVSEPDKGIYNAMNKGVAVAKGEYCLFMNSGDCMYNNSVIGDVLSQGLDADVVCGDTIRDNVVGKSEDKITMLNLLSHTLAHQASFIKTAMLRSNKYDENLRIVSDWKFFFEEFLFSGVSYRHINYVVAVFDMTGISMMNQEKLFRERELVLQSFFPKPVLVEVRKFFGETDEYYKLFVSIGESPNKWRFYNCVVAILKCVFFWKGWVKGLKMHRT